MLKNTIEISATPLDFSVLGPMILTHLSKMLRLGARSWESSQCQSLGQFPGMFFFGGGRMKQRQRCYVTNRHWYFIFMVPY